MEPVEPRVESAADRQSHHRPGVGDDRAQGTEAITVDPVCGMRVDPATAAERRDTASGSYFFCSAQCAAAFDADPDRYRTTAAERAHEGGEVR